MTEGICIDQWFLSFLWLRRTWGIWHCVFFDWAQLLLSPLHGDSCCLCVPSPPCGCCFYPQKGQETLDMAAHWDSVVLANFIPLSSVACQFCVLASARNTCFPFFTYISHWKLLGETMLCGIIFSINRFFWVDEDAAVLLYWGHLLFRSQIIFFSSQTLESLMENALLQTLGVLPWQVMTKNGIYHSSQCWETEKHVLKLWMSMTTRRDNVITAAPNNRDTGNKARISLPLLFNSCTSLQFHYISFFVSLSRNVNSCSAWAETLGLAIMVFPLIYKHSEVFTYH